MRPLTSAATCLCALISIAAAQSAQTDLQSSTNILPKHFKPPQVFKNVNLLRNINLEKGYVRETINVVIETTDSAPQSEYYLPFKAELVGKVGGLEVRDKKNPEVQAFRSEIIEYDPYR